MKFVCTGEENGTKNTHFHSEGKTFLHALGLIDLQIKEAFDSEMLDHESVEEIRDLMQAYEEGKQEYKRIDFSTPESNWVLNWKIYNSK